MPENEGNDVYGYGAPGNLPDGIIDVKVVAWNDLTSSEQTVTVTKGSPCTSADTCLTGQACTEGRCAWPAPTGELGDACTYNEACISRQCLDDGTEQLCTKECVVGVADQCGEGLECLAFNTGGLCWPAAGEEPGGCCSVGDDDLQAGQIVLLALVATGIVVLPRRRRRARA